MFEFLKKKSKHAGPLLRVTDSNISFKFKEAFNRLTVNLMYSISKKGTKKVLFTSSSSGEGKSMDSYNVAATLAQSGKKVILVDLDLRKPVQHKYSKLIKDKGIVDILCGLIPVSEAIKRDEAVGMDVITAGRNAVNPLKLFTSDFLPEMIQELENMYDWIIIDTPPIGVVSDANMIVPYTDGVVVVVDQKETRYPQVEEVLNSLQLAGANIVGTVLNNSNMDSDSGAYRRKYYGYHYYSGYGESESSESPATINSDVSDSDVEKAD